ncbi:MAG: hypothetical protein B7Y02_18255 [Rhodobacterales bacterium 17-64-5]|nr:MAG: hypothetical protein B7Y02_18255 [Rhodobacterales bacterium 17-64-5]
MLAAALTDHPGARIVIRSHPETLARLRPGHFDAHSLAAGTDRITLLTTPVSPHHLLRGAAAVYTVSSQLGFEAILHGHVPHVFGQPFYAGWGLTRDLAPVPERRLRAPDGHPLPLVTLQALTHAALIAYPRYWDPVTRRPCPPEVALERLAASTLPRGVTGLRLLAKAQGHLAGLAHLWR